MYIVREYLAIFYIGTLDGSKYPSSVQRDFADFRLYTFLLLEDSALMSKGGLNDLKWIVFPNWKIDMFEAAQI